MKKISNKGFGKVELMAMLALIAILLAVGSKIVLDNTGKNYGNFKTVANNLANAVSKYKDRYPKDSNIYYLYEVQAKGYIDELKNPLKTTQECDVYDSYVEVPEPNNKKVYLTCGDYIVEGVQGKTYMVYEVGEWQDEQESDTNDNGTIYNYKKGEKVMLPEYISKNTFIHEFYVRENTRISTPFAVNKEKDMKLLTKQVYRTKTLLKEIK
ncbi:MAG: hypothetical protein IKO78_05585 [Bacilli bacterium]|nr:hypothetical protein [Bacilli bacterium]